MVLLMSNLTSEQQLAKLEEWIALGAKAGSKGESVKCTICGDILTSDRANGVAKFIVGSPPCAEPVCNWVPFKIEM